MPLHDKVWFQYEYDDGKHDPIVRELIDCVIQLSLDVAKLRLKLLATPDEEDATRWAMVLAQEMLDQRMPSRKVRLLLETEFREAEKSAPKERG